MSSKISLYRGDSHSVVVTVTSDGSTPVNLTGGSAKLSVRKTGSTYLIQVTGTLSAPTLGQTTFTFLPADTQTLTPGGYTYDVQVTLSGGSVYTPLLGVFELKEDVTRP